MAGGSSRGGGAPPSVTNLKETLVNAALTADFRAYLRYLWLHRWLQSLPQGTFGYTADFRVYLRYIWQHRRLQSLPQVPVATPQSLDPTSGTFGYTADFRAYRRYLW
jgi:hypothetical protein